MGGEHRGKASRSPLGLEQGRELGDAVSHEVRYEAEPGLSVKSAWLPVTAGLRDWRAQLDADDVLRFEAAAGGLMDELGYPRAAAFVPRRERARAARIRETFIREARARGRPVPRAWVGGALARHW